MTTGDVSVLMMALLPVPSFVLLLITSLCTLLLLYTLVSVLVLVLGFLSDWPISSSSTFSRNKLKSTGLSKLLLMWLLLSS